MTAENPGICCSVNGGRGVEETKERYPRLLHFQPEHVLFPGTCTTGTNTDANLINQLMINNNIERN